MTAVGRVHSEFLAATRAFLRRRTAVFFTFFFPVVLVVIFGALVQTQPTGGGLFTEPPAYYIPGYLAVVAVFTPLSRVGSEVARHRDGNRFEKLATTPLSRPEWLLAQTLVNTVVIGLAGLLLFGLVVLLTAPEIEVTAVTLPALGVFLVLGVALFCGLGALLGSWADSQDGVIAASNAIALPLVFLSDTFVPPSLLPAWFRPVIWLSPLTYFSTGVRTLLAPGLQTGDGPGTASIVGPVPLLVILAVLAAVLFAAGAYALPRTD
jgi:ABC-2 type transport system permease protein